jgi:aminoglycoside 6'-N-acetyltransferase
VIRRIRKTDVPALVKILKQPEVAAWWGPYTRTKLEKEIAESSFAWVILVEREPAGYIQVWEERDKNSRHVDIDIFLAGEHQGRGVGPDAMRAALSWMFEKRGHHRATLWTSPANRNAISAYEKLGFRKVGITRKSDRRPDGVWEDELFMELLAEEMT